jgi:hypothetical protein
MRKGQRYLGLAAGLGVLVAVLSMTGGGSALAQGALKPLEALIVNDSARPVPVSNVNERSRRPFSYDDVGTCNAVNCFFDYPVVPEGKRLVILHVNGIARPQSTTTIFDQAELLTNNTENEFGARNTFGMALIGQEGAAVAANTWGFNSAVLAVVEAGQFARVTMRTRNGGSTFFSQATIAGYLEDID